MTATDAAAGPELSAEFVEREYNLRAAFPDHPQWFAKYAADSAAARARLRSRLDLRYGPGPKQTLDLFPADTSGPRGGTLLFIHGGYWRALDKSDHSFVAPPLVEQGINVVVINYDLCPTSASRASSSNVARPSPGSPTIARTDWTWGR